MEPAQRERSERKQIAKRHANLEGTDLDVCTRELRKPCEIINRETTHPFFKFVPSFQERGRLLSASSSQPGCAFQITGSNTALKILYAPNTHVGSFSSIRPAGMVDMYNYSLLNPV